MGTKILGVIAFAAIAIAADWNYQQNRQALELILSQNLIKPQTTDNQVQITT